METLRLAALARLHPLSFEQLGDIAPCASEQTVQAGTRLLHDGPLYQELVLIGTGRAAVRCAGERIAELGPGDVFGELAPRRAIYPAATVMALTDLSVVVFSSRDLRRLVQAAPDALAALIQACSIAPRDRAVALAGDRPAAHLTLVSAAA